MSNNAIIMGEFKEFCLWLRRNRDYLEPLVEECKSEKYRSAYSAFESAREKGHKMPNVYRAPFARMLKADYYTTWKLGKSSKWAYVSRKHYGSARFMAFYATDFSWQKWLKSTFGDA